MVVPGLPMVGLVRTRLLWWVAVAVLAVACIVGPVATVRSDDAQAGLAMLLAPYAGLIALVVLGVGDAVVRRAARRRRT